MGIYRPRSPNRNHSGWKAFQQQRTNARRRGIEWELTFTQWWDIWKSSGHWDERGRKNNQYCMTRIGDAGPYAINNVAIATNYENHLMSKPVPHTTEFKKALSERNRGNKYGKGQKKGFKHSEESKRKTGEASKHWWKTSSPGKIKARNRKISQSLQGHECSAETRRKIRAAHKTRGCP